MYICYIGIDSSYTAFLHHYLTHRVFLHIHIFIPIEVISELLPDYLDIEKLDIFSWVNSILPHQIMML